MWHSLDCDSEDCKLGGALSPACEQEALEQGIEQAMMLDLDDEEN
jgi:hypothetical protein